MPVHTVFYFCSFVVSFDIRTWRTLLLLVLAILVDIELLLLRSISDFVILSNCFGVACWATMADHTSRVITPFGKASFHYG